MSDELKKRIMREKMQFSFSYSVNGKARNLNETIFTFFNFLFIIVLIEGCTKSVSYDSSIGDPLKAGIESVIPADLSGSTFVDPVVAVNFKADIDPAVVATAVITLKKGTTTIPGAVTITGSTASFASEADLQPESEYLATVKTLPTNKSYLNLTHEYTWKFITGKLHRIDSLSVISVLPLDKTTSVPVNTPVVVVFNQELSSSMKSAISITMKKGTSAVSGTIVFSGKTATLQPSSTLLTGTVYSCNVLIGSGQYNTDNKSGKSLNWSFTTMGVATDVIAPVVTSVVPVNATTTASTTTKVSVTFSEAMNASKINTSSFTLKQGSTAVAGTVTYSGLTASFTPSAALIASAVYTATITTAATDVAGNALASNYTWNFTTAAAADLTPPTVLSSVPVSGAASISTSTKVSATFSETMDATTITNLSFSLNQGSTSITGTVSYTGMTATFSPSAALAGNTVYTATITTGAKDVSGNALTSNYTWSFTTAAAVPTGKSFATDVMPILTLCNNCHTHPWTTSTNASTFYSNLLNGGYINATTPTSGKIYTKLSGGHPPGSTVSAAQVTTILTWITEGSKNN
jgi:hypothetical protein